MRQSKIWQLSEAEFRAIVAHSASYSEVLHKIGTSQGGDHYHLLKKRIAFLHLEAGHLLQGKYIGQGKLAETKIPLQDILVEHSPYPRIHLKPRLIARGLLENQCAICGLAPQWEGKHLVLAMDHINGVKDDHRLENLRLVCPNCHSQTDTFASRNRIKRKEREGITMPNPKPKSYLHQRKKSSTYHISLEELFVAHTRRNSENLKKRLVQENLLLYQCAFCGRGPEWEGKELVLVLDHINGVHDDNRLENLRFLCPNCNSQTDTFAGKHIPKPRKERFCKECGASITRYSTLGLCISCVNKNRRKAERPSQAELARLTETHGFCAVGRMFGVSDNAIRKWLRQKPAAEEELR